MDELKFEIERKNFIRAEQIAASRNVSNDKRRDLQLQALWQMAAENRNAIGVKMLAEKYKISKGKLIKYLEEKARQINETGNTKALSKCYNMQTGQYFTFEEWLDFYSKNWKNF